MNYLAFYSVLLLLILLRLTLQPFLISGSNAIGSHKNPIKLMLAPSVEANKITSSADSLIAFLHKKTDLSFTASIPTSFIIVVESFGSGAADMAITNTFGYVLAHEKYGAEAAMMVLRRAGDNTYRGQIIVRAESGITSLEQWNGKKFAFVDAASISGFVLPKALLGTNNIRLTDSVFAGKHDNVVTMVYQKQVDAVATYYSSPDPKTGEFLDARARVRTQYPDVFEMVKIIALTDEIPNDPIVFRKDFPGDLKKQIISALIDFQSTSSGLNVLFETYSIEGLAPAGEHDSDKLHAMIRTFGGDLNEVIGKKKQSLQ